MESAPWLNVLGDKRYCVCGQWPPTTVPNLCHINDSVGWLPAENASVLVLPGSPVCVSVSVYLCLCVSLCVCICMCMCVCMSVFVCVWVRVCVHVRVLYLNELNWIIKLNYHIDWSEREVISAGSLWKDIEIILTEVKGK